MAGSAAGMGSITTGNEGGKNSLAELVDEGGPGASENGSGETPREDGGEVGGRLDLDGEFIGFRNGLKSPRARMVLPERCFVLFLTGEKGLKAVGEPIVCTARAFGGSVVLWLLVACT